MAIQEEEDYKILSFETNVKLLEDAPIDNIVKFEPSYTKSWHETSFKDKSYAFFKRAFDIVVSGTGLVLLSPVFLLTSIAIRCQDKGPAIFIQQRIGKNGKVFNLYKFRSMKENADKILYDMLQNDEEVAKEYGMYKKLKDDPRVTTVGKFIRRTSIDELPQLINIFKGEMSVVGPRPYLVREKPYMGEAYDSIIESKPGLTGLWQVNGRASTTFEERLKFDKEYVESKGAFYDMGILFKTIGSVAKGDGAE